MDFVMDLLFSTVYAEVSCARGFTRSAQDQALRLTGYRALTMVYSLPSGPPRCDTGGVRMHNHSPHATLSVASALVYPPSDP